MPSTKHDKPREESYWPTIGNKSQLTRWLRDNDYILEGHPLPTYSYRRSFRLWRCWHMETMNIWTHLLGSTAFVLTGLALAQYALFSTTLRLSYGDIFAFGTYLLSAATCFALSTTFHTLRSHSYNVHHFWGRMDILGICILAFGGGTSMSYYALYCESAMQRQWVLNLFTALAGAYRLCETGGGGSRMRALRGGTFTFLGVLEMCPFVYSVMRLGWEGACDEIGAEWYLAEGLCLVLGVGIFVSRVPERFSPGTFDVLGHSHQLFHLFAVLGAVFHVAALVTGYTYRQMHPVC